MEISGSQTMLQIGARRTDASPSMDVSPVFPGAEVEAQSSLDVPRLGLGCRIFLSHSGVDKEFVKELYTLLNAHHYRAFYDEATLQKMRRVTMANILQEIEPCELVIFVLSEAFFSKTRNPMLELVASVDAADIKILPLFYKITVEELQERKETWYGIWERWQQEDVDKGRHPEDPLRINLSKWKSSLTRLRETCGIVRKREETDTNYRSTILRKLYETMKPDIDYHDSDTQGKERLCRAVDDMFNTAAQDCTPAFVGLYGIKGLGKTTLCRSLLNFYKQRYEGRAFRVQLDSANSEDQSLEDLKKALCCLAGTPAQTLENLHDVGQGWSLWKQSLPKLEVFLAIDNVNDTTLREASKYLTSASFRSGSRILVISRSRQFLEALHVHIPSLLLAPLPKLSEEEAIEIFVRKANGAQPLTAKRRRMSKKCIDKCLFENRYHAGMIEALGERFLMYQVFDWDRYLEVPSFKHSHFDSEIQVLKTVWDALQREEQLTFLDAALYTPTHLNGVGDVRNWLSCLHQARIEEIEIRLKRLSCMSVLKDDWEITGSSCIVHELYKACATKIVEGHIECLYVENKSVSRGLWSTPLGNGLRRIGLRSCTFPGPTRVSFDVCKDLNVLCFHESVGLREVMLEHAVNLQSIEIVLEKSRKPVAIRGLKYLEKLVCLSSYNCEWEDWDASIESGSMAGLKQLRVEFSSSKRLSFSSCCNLRRICLNRCEQLEKLTGLNSLYKLRELTVNDCTSLSGRLPLTPCTSLEKIQITGCRNLELTGLSSLRSLKELRLQDTKLAAADEIAELSGLENLRLRCTHTMHPELKNLVNLRTLELEERCSQGAQDCWSGRGPNLELLTKVEFLKIKSCNRLFELHGLDQCTALVELSLSGCGCLEALPDIGKCKALRRLNLSHCKFLTALPDMRSWTALEYLNIDYTSFFSFPELPLQSLKTLHMRGCIYICIREVVSQLTPAVSCAFHLADFLCSSCSDPAVVADLLTEFESARNFVIHFSHSFEIHRLLYWVYVGTGSLQRRGLLSKGVTEGVMDGLAKTIVHLKTILQGLILKFSKDVDEEEELLMNGDGRIDVLERLLMRKEYRSRKDVRQCILRHRFLAIVADGGDESWNNACVGSVVESVALLCVWATSELRYRGWGECASPEESTGWIDAFKAAGKLVKKEDIVLELQRRCLKGWIEEKLPILERVISKYDSNHGIRPLTRPLYMASASKKKA